MGIAKKIKRFMNFFKEEKRWLSSRAYRSNRF